jgi:hypothetical protein
MALTEPALESIELWIFLLPLIPEYIELVIREWRTVIELVAYEIGSR